MTNDVQRTRSVTDQRDHQAVDDEEDVPSGLPGATLTMLVIIVVVFVAMVWVGHGDIGRAARLFGDKESDLIRAGQWWRLITPIFLHGSWIHLLFNGLSLLWFGGQMEAIYGARKYFLIYMVSGIAGNLLSFLLLPAPSLGASGALFGLIGAGIVFPIRFPHLLHPQARKAILKQLTLVAGINLGLSFAAGIDRYAHFGGFLGGAFVAVFLVPDVLDDRPRTPIREVMLTGATLLMIGLVALASLRQWNEAHEEAYPEFITYARGDGNAVYRFQLSRRWRPRPQHADNGSVWVGPGGATIHVVDSHSDTDLFEHTEQWRAEYGAVGAPINVDGRSATLTTVNAGGRVMQLCEILADRRAVDIVLCCRTDDYAAARNDYATLLESLRFTPPRFAIHPFSLPPHGFSLHNFPRPAFDLPAHTFVPGRPAQFSIRSNSTAAARSESGSH